MTYAVPAAAGMLYPPTERSTTMTQQPKHASGRVKYGSAERWIGVVVVLLTLALCWGVVAWVIP